MVITNSILRQFCRRDEKRNKPTDSTSICSDCNGKNGPDDMIRFKMKNLVQKVHKRVNILSQSVSGLIDYLTYDDTFDNIHVRRSPKKLLYGTFNDEEHYEKVEEYIRLSKPLHGEEGLRALGFGYRAVSCDVHRVQDEEGEEKKVENEISVFQEDCDDCVTKLFHVEANTMITLNNRREFIAD